MCKEAGYGVSIFGRLQQFVSEKQMLKIQFAMHPSIIQFSNNYFYNGNVKDGPNVMSIEFTEFAPGTLPYGFMDVSTTELRHIRKAYVSSAAIFMLVRKFCKGIVFSS